jgi:hypothetical protein
MVDPASNIIRLRAVDDIVGYRPLEPSGLWLGLEPRHRGYSLGGWR